MIEIQLSQKISVPKRESRFYDFLSEQEIEKFLDGIDDNNLLGIRDKTIFEIFYSTGIRISELENIKIQDIDLKNMEILVFGKGRKERVAFLNEKTLFSLKKYLQIRQSFLFDKKRNGYKTNDYLFLNIRGGRLSQRYIRNLLSKYLDHSGIKKPVSPHGLRHSFATHMLQEGANIRAVQELLGHTSLNSTQIYTHINLKKMKEDFMKYHPRAK
jgi:site-specific recombinase XerD